MTKELLEEGPGGSYPKDELYLSQGRNGVNGTRQETLA
jgi:hypothetical protein